jgi:3-hydroxybutyryl-CoA dehydrogenase
VHLEELSVEPVGVVGGGAMGVGIAYVFAVAGHATTVVEPDAVRARQVLRTIDEVAADGIRRGKLDADGAAALSRAVTIVDDIGRLPTGLALVVESVPERLGLKQQVLGEIDQRDPRLIATNTSALSIDQLADAVTNPATFLGMHFFNPVWSLALVEIVRGAQTGDAAIAAALDLVASIGKQPIVVSDTPGFATSRLDLIASLEAMRMLEDGVASAVDIDRAMVVAYRHPIGPLRLSDVVGLDVRLDIARNLAVELGPRYAPPAILEELVATGHLGQKSGRGFFEWPDAIDRKDLP